jgi:hypothetical protein
MHALANLEPGAYDASEWPWCADESGYTTLRRRR